jgi:transcriptional regulator with XRE-family HTH domain
MKDEKRLYNDRRFLLEAVVVGEIIIPAQVRAARALLDWSQNELASAANVGVTTVRDIESERRATDTDAMRQIRRALDNAGVEFVSGTSDFGPGVRMVRGRPHLIRQPVFDIYVGLFFAVEWQGREVTVCVSYEVIQDLGRFSGSQSEAVYHKLFLEHRGKILDATTRALAEGKLNRHDRINLTAEDFPGLVPAISLST